MSVYIQGLANFFCKGHIVTTCRFVGHTICLQLLNSAIDMQKQPSVQFSSVAQLCPTLCDPMNCSTLGFPVHHQHLELAQTHVHQVGDTIQPSHPLSPPPPPAYNLSQNQSLFQWISSLHQMAKVLELRLQLQFFQYSWLISFRIDWLDPPAVQGTLKSLQHHSSKASTLQCSVWQHINEWMLLPSLSSLCSLL